MSKTSIPPMLLAASSASVPDDGSAAIRAIAQPPKACPICYAEQGQRFPSTHSTAICPTHATALRIMSDARKQQREARA